MAYDYDEIAAGLVTNRTKPVDYTYSDRNRVETAADAMAEMVSTEGYYVDITVKTNWNGATRSWANWVSKENITRYLNNVKKIQEQFFPVGNVVLPTTIYDIDYIGANNIEKFLAGIPALVRDMQSRYRRCNTFNCGT